MSPGPSCRAWSSAVGAASSVATTSTTRRTSPLLGRQGRGGDVPAHARAQVAATASVNVLVGRKIDTDHAGDRANAEEAVDDARSRRRCSSCARTIGRDRARSPSTGPLDPHRVDGQSATYPSAPDIGCVNTRRSDPRGCGQDHGHQQTRWRAGPDRRTGERPPRRRLPAMATAARGQGLVRAGVLAGAPPSTRCPKPRRQRRRRFPTMSEREPPPIPYRTSVMRSSRRGEDQDRDPGDGRHRASASPIRRGTRRSHGEIALAACDQPSGNRPWPSCSPVASPTRRQAPAARHAADRRPRRFSRSDIEPRRGRPVAERGPTPASTLARGRHADHLLWARSRADG
jgi:hypothetical protein